MFTAGKDGDQNDHAFEDLLIVGLDIEQVEQVVDHGKGAHPRQGAKDAATPSTQDGTADDAGRNRIKLEARAHAWLRNPQAGSQDYPSQGSKNPGKDVSEADIQADIDACEAHGLLISADRYDRPSGAGPVKEEPD